ncbi:MAG: hypothetical protein M1823_002933 [Watsoniomyces obsoletus]|nr:MAG: hypothetical protein M1823_002933 [Watsoniomyces obsoletus]
MQRRSVRFLTAATVVVAPKPCRSARRCFHSDEREPPPGPYGPIETKILSAAIRQVPEYGFTETALVRGAQHVGYLDASINLFPRGVFDLVHYHLVDRREALKEEVAADQADQAGPGSEIKSNHVDTSNRSHTQQGRGSSEIRPEIVRLARARLMANRPVIHRWHEALAMMAQPAYVASSLAELGRLSDEMCFLAGDTSLDSSWYTKRARLAAIYASSELYMTQDRSPNYTDTHEFLERRLHEAEVGGNTVSQATTWLDFTRHAFVNVLRSKGAPI